MGTGAPTPNASDVQLQAEVARSALAVNSRNANITTYQFLFPAGLATATLQEAGVFLNASGTANSGTMLNHLIMSPAEVKTASLVLVVTIAFTVVDRSYFIL